jgi:RHS repeat-associated protein
MAQTSSSTTALQVCAFAYKFTGKERDTESGNDYFGARYYGSSMGRFMSPDYDQLPDTVPYADFSNPQSLNLYAYAGNSPVSSADANGHDVTVCDNNGHCSAPISDDAYKAAQRANAGTLNGPSLSSLQNSASGSGTLTSTDANGNTTNVGTVQWTPDNPGIQGPAAMAGFNQLGNTSRVVKAGTAIYAGAYGVAFFGPAAAGFGSTAITLGVSSGPAIFAAGQLFEHTFETNAGEVGFLAEVETSGSTLILKDVAVYPTGTPGALNVGTGQAMQALHQLESLARSQGFTQLQITGTRLSGANPGGIVNITRNLK